MIRKTDTSPVYLGFTVTGVTVEISNVVLQNETGLLYETLPIAAGPVMVSRVIISGPLRNPVTDAIGNYTVHYQNSLAGAQRDVIQLTAAVIPSIANDPTVSWSSTEQSIATVTSEGLVSLLAPGAVAIVATANDGTGFEDRFMISLTNDPDPVAAVSVVGPNVFMTPNMQAFTAVITPSYATDQTLSWASSDPAILSIDPDTRVASVVSAGTATITATATDTGAVSGSLEVTIRTGNTLAWNFADLPVTWPIQDIASAATTNTPLGPDITLANVAVPFTLTLNYTGAGTAERYPGVLIDGVAVDPAAPASTGTSDPRSFSYTYCEAGPVTITLTSEGNAIRLYDLFLTQAAD